MATFFKLENHPYPPSLSDRGKLRLGKKSDLLTILLEHVEVEEPPIQYHVKVLDGTAIVHLFPTTNATTFEDYAKLPSRDLDNQWYSTAAVTLAGRIWMDTGFGKQCMDSCMDYTTTGLSSLR